MSRWLLVLCQLSLVAFLGCSRSEKAEPASQPAASVAQAEAPAAVVGAEPVTKIADDQIPTEEDFESEAERKISASNLEAALDELEREIGE